MANVLSVKNKVIFLSLIGHLVLSWKEKHTHTHTHTEPRSDIVMRGLPQWATQRVAVQLNINKAA